jgi:ribosomal protein S12
MGKPRGLRTARKHVKNRRENVWADLDYKKAHLGTRWKANPFGGASHAKGIVLEKVRYFYYISNIKKPLVLWSSVSTYDKPSFHEFS